MTASKRPSLFTLFFAPRLSWLHAARAAACMHKFQHASWRCCCLGRRCPLTFWSGLGRFNTHLLPSMTNCFISWHMTPSTTLQPYASAIFANTGATSPTFLPGRIKRSAASKHMRVAAIRSAFLPVTGPSAAWTTAVCACVAMKPSIWTPRSLRHATARRRGAGQTDGGCGAEAAGARRRRAAQQRPLRPLRQYQASEYGCV
eukprot:351161-Chlamydomonas_euryale.AAC.5